MVRIGILGGGQLGLMLLQSVQNIFDKKKIESNIFFSILDPDKSAPCAIFPHFSVGNFNDYQTVMDFAENLDILTVEIEHVCVSALFDLEKKGKKVFPQASVLQLIQDKGLQKEFYIKNKIPTASFSLVNEACNISPDSFPCVQKLRLGGYDGKGVKILKNKNEERLIGPCVIEEMIDLQKEIAVIVARNLKGEMKVFPTVELTYNSKANLVDYLFSPAHITLAQEQTAQEIAKKVAENLGIVGTLAVEMFLTKKGDILVNECAPRPHNSGHHTIEACTTSQYEQHLRAILDLPLGDTLQKTPALMFNILGPEHLQGEVSYSGMEFFQNKKDIFIHLYGKKETKPYRKLGHVTILDDHKEEQLKKMQEVKQKLSIFLSI